MALKKTDRKVGAPRATIGVNRGGGNRELGNAVASSNMTGAINNWLRTKTAELKKSEQDAGEKLGKAATLVYEDYEDSDGNITQVASSYETPDNMIKTSWKAHSFEEEATEKLVSGMLVGAKNIIENERTKIRSNINLDHSVAQMKTAFRKNLNNSLGVVQDKVPAELKDYFKLKTEEMILSEESVLANKHLTLMQTYTNAKVLKDTNTMSELLTTLSYADPEQASIKIQELENNLQMYNAKGMTQAKLELETRLKGFKVLTTMGKNLSQYTTSDYSNNNSSNVKMFSKNLQQLQILFNEGPGSVVSLTNIKTGEQEEVSFESLGVSSNQYMEHATEMRQSFSRLQNFVGAKFTASAKDTNLNILTDLSLKNNKTMFTEKSDIKYGATQLMDLDSNFSQKLIGEYNAAVGGNVTSGNLEDNPARLTSFYQWVASTTGIVREDKRLEVEGLLMNDSLSARNISAIIENPMWNVMTGAELIINKNTSKVTDVISTMGLSDKAMGRAMALRNSITLYGVTDGITDYIQQTQRNEAESYTPLDVATQGGFKSALELTNDIQNHVRNSFSKIIADDPIISLKFQRLVTNNVMKHLQGNPSLVSKRNNLVDDVIAQVLKTGNFGESQYALGVDSVSSGGDEINLKSNQPSFTQYPPDPYLQTESQMDLIQEKLDAVNTAHLEEEARGYYSRADALVLGENVHLQLIGNPHNSDQAVYRFVFSENDGSRQQMILDNDNYVLTVSVSELTQRLFEVN